MVGKAKYNVGQNVKISLVDSDGLEKVYDGFIVKVDPWGLRYDDEEVTYKVYIDKCDDFPQGMDIEHISENNILG